METLTRRLFQIIALSAFAIGQPVLQKLGAAPEFFITRRSSALDLIILTLGLLLVLPLLFYTLEALCSKLVGKKFGAKVHAAVLLLLASLVFLPIVAGQIHSVILYSSISACLAILLVIGILRVKVLSQFSAFMALFAIISGGSFIWRPGIWEIITAKQAEDSQVVKQANSSTPIVMLVFDEFPLSGLLNDKLEIDAARFPNFANLANQSTWYKNATAVSTHTTLAVPAILTGQLPSKDRRYPDLRSHPNNLFTAFSNSHVLHVWESHTQLCPAKLCAKDIPNYSLLDRLESLFWDTGAVALNTTIPANLGVPLPKINMNWGDFWGEKKKHKKKKGKIDPRRGERLRIFRQWNAEIAKLSRQPLQQPVLHFSHHLLPHMPYQFTPKGLKFEAGYSPSAYPKEQWLNQPWSIKIAYQQFTFQLAALDLLIGELIKQLKESAIWDKSLLIVTADHGASFEIGTHRRGHASDPYFFEDLLSIPLFIKYPGQQTAKVDFKSAESVDILPTIAQVQGVTLPWQVDGVSLLAEDFPRRSVKRMVVGEKRAQKLLTEENLSFEALTFKIPEKFSRHTLDWKISFLPTIEVRDAYAFTVSDYRELLGRKVIDGDYEKPVKVELTTPLKVASVENIFSVAVQRKSGELPLYFTGKLQKPSAVTYSVVIVMNQKIAAIVPCLLEAELAADTCQFEALLSEELLKEGENLVNISLLRH